MATNLVSKFKDDKVGVRVRTGKIYICKEVIKWVRPFIAIIVTVQFLKLKQNSSK